MNLETHLKEAPTKVNSEFDYPYPQYFEVNGIVYKADADGFHIGNYTLPMYRVDEWNGVIQNPNDFSADTWAFTGDCTVDGTSVKCVGSCTITPTTMIEPIVSGTLYRFGVVVDVVRGSCTFKLNAFEHGIEVVSDGYFRCGYIRATDPEMPRIVTSDDFIGTFTYFDCAYVEPYTFEYDGIWTIAPLGNNWVGTNGHYLVYCVSHAICYVNPSIHVRGLCNQRGRIIMGGFDSFHITIGGSTVGMCGLNSVFWTGVGGAGFREIFIDRATNAPVHEFEELYRRGDMGWETVPSIGTILNVQVLGDGFCAYGTNGVSYFKRVSSPLPTYGRMDVLSGKGIPSRHAAVGMESGNYFIDNDGNLWTQSADNKIQRIGYDYLFSEESLSEVVLHLDTVKQDLYISFPTSGYIFANGALSEIQRTFVSLYHHNGVLYGSFDDFEDDTVQLTSSVMDFGSRGFKSVFGVEIVCDNPLAYTLYVYTRNSQSGDMIVHEYSFNERGTTMFNLVAIEFQFEIVGTVNENNYIDDVNVIWKLDDVSGARGVMEYGTVAR